MKVCLAENIRAFRKEKQLTQEQLAEVLQVTVGTISKWESGASTPDLALIMEMADFFGTSVDLLLGFAPQSSGRAELIEQIRRLYRSRAFDEGRCVCEKAVQRYPHDFDVLYASATLYQLAGLEQRDAVASRRADALYQQALEHLDQNTDPEISAVILQNDRADVAMDLGEPDRAIRLLQENNVAGVNNVAIGFALANIQGRQQEARPYLEKALLDIALMRLTRLCVAYTIIGCSDSAAAAEARDLCHGVEALFQTFNEPNTITRMDKVRVMLLTDCALLNETLGQTEAADEDLCRAYRLASRFDAHPAEGMAGIRFVHDPKLTTKVVIYDDFGDTACAGVAAALEKEERLARLWADLCGGSAAGQKSGGA